MLKSPQDLIIVQLDKAFQDEIVTESGFKLFQATDLNPEWHTTVTGTVISTPDKLTKRHEHEGLTIEPVEGERIIFSYMVVFDMEVQDRDTPIHHNLFYHEGQYYWKVEYIHYLGRVINGEVRAAQGYVFVEKLTTEDEPSGLIYLPEMAKKKVAEGKGRVVSVGRPKNITLSVQKGDTVRYPERYACKYDIEGKQYIIITESQVLARED